MSDLIPMDHEGLTRFLHNWYGPAPSPHADVDDSAAAPPELVEWHKIAARWNSLLTPHNYAIPLPELTEEDGKIFFWVENQGVWEWAFDPDDKDHAVYERPPSDEPGPWLPTGESLTHFLIHATMTEAALGAPAGKTADNVELRLLAVQPGTTVLPFPAWNWPTPGTRLLTGQNWLALAHPSNHTSITYDITLAARAIEDLDWADKMTQINWRLFDGAKDHSTIEPLPW
jgi:hypothetical protein